MATETADIDLLVTLLRSARAKTQAQMELKESGLPFTGDWDMVEARIRRSITQGKILFSDWTALLGSIEDNGYQHIFLYRASPDYLPNVISQRDLLAKANGLGLAAVFGQERLVNLPDDPMLVRITRQNTSMSFKWIEKRQWKERIDSRTEETITGITETVQYEIRQGRGIALFKMDLATGVSEMRIGRFDARDRDNDYPTKVQYYFEQLQPFLDTNQIAPINLVGCVNKINDLAFSEVTHNGSKIMSINQVRIQAKGRKGKNLEGERIWRAALESAPNDFYAEDAQVDWIDSVAKPVAIKITRDSNEILVYDHCREDDIDHVLSRIIFLN